MFLLVFVCCCRTKRAVWRYSRDRAAIASRWSWLLSQIADLEIKIRQNNEYYQDYIQANSDPVISEDEQSCLVAAVASNEMQSNDPDDADSEEEMTEEELRLLSMGSSRTRGQLSSKFRKRKCEEANGLHYRSKKAQKPRYRSILTERN